MERPSSQLEHARPSGLKAPSASRLPMSASSRALQDVPPSELNSKSHMPPPPPPPPPATTGKHKMTGSVSESAPKRKTLVERAGEPLHQARSHMPQPRTYGMSASAMSRTAHGVRTVNNSISTARLASSHSRIQNVSQQHSGHSVANGWDPQSGAEEDDTEYTGRRKGVPIMSLSPRNITVRKSRHRGCFSKSHPLPSRARSQHLSSFSAAYAEQYVPSSRKKEVGEKNTSRRAEVDEAVLDLVTVMTLEQRNDVCGSGEIVVDETRRKASPSKLPKPAQVQPHTPCTPTPQSLRFIERARSCKPKDDPVFFATKSSLTPLPAWDTAGRLQDMDRLLLTMQEQMTDTANSKVALEEAISVYKVRVEELNLANRELAKDHRAAISDLERARTDLHRITIDLEQARRDHVRSQSDLEKTHQQRVHDVEMHHVKQLRHLEREGERAVEQLEKEVSETKKSLEKQQEGRISDLTSEHWEEIDQLKAQHEKLMSELQQQIEALRKSDEGRAAESASTVQGLRNDIATLQAQSESLNATIQVSRTQLAAAESRNAGLEQEKANLISKTHFLEGNQEAQSEEFTSMTRRLQEAEARASAAVVQLRKEETVRRRLNAQILELKGNIRVFARMRPVLAHEEEPARVEYPDADELEGGKEMLVHAPTTFSATGKERNEKHAFGFDRVFGPNTTNSDVFNDCRELVQSVIDGYNVSILSYGQTGSGKTYGMSGTDGIIPSSIELLLSEIQRLKQKGWEYAVEASFVEVYNETLNDLLGDAKTWDQEDDTSAATRSKSKMRHEIHHDATTGKTTVSNLTAVSLWPPFVKVSDDGLSSSQSYTRSAVARLLETATKNRRVAATKANERSSRSHSVFLLTLKGSCEATSESSEGILNLVDLAGSERLKHSGAEGGRAKETAAINTSLKSLGDVIEKVGSGGHVPYRNSKLTYLLQSSLGGTAASGKSSRTLMLLHLSPLQAHWQETKTSLQFGTKVHGTHIGTAKKK